MSVFFAGDPGNARGGAVLYHVVEAVLEVLLGRFQRPAGAQAELLPDGLQGRTKGVAVGEGAEIAGTILAP